ncbi:hypothetical protein BKA64DRAFT_669972 [Cadophora sp. MPI-SDFR-AT-0126]|nr:hypothetical protein BKA64DRAFT_669972 [Leotiomycetes sp. MPI-SDFR-AT-0126]
MRSTRNSKLSPSAETFACRVCKKSISSGPSYKRHERYCRQRLASPAPPRRKSCLACIRAKCRCDSDTPACGPCDKKGRSCVYSVDNLVAKRGESGITAIAARSSTRLPVSEYLTASSSSTTTREHSQSASFNSGASPLESDLTASNALFKLSKTPGSKPISKDTSGDGLATDRTRGEPSLVLHPPPSSQLLRPRKMKSVRSELISNLVTQMLCSYPERRLDEASLPPFIHHSTIHRSAKSPRSNNAIIICQEIVQNYTSDTTHKDPTFWNVIAAEQERIYANRSTFDKWTTMDSAQALTVYLLMAASSGEPVLARYPSIPITLLYTLGSLFGSLNIIHPGFSASTKNGRPPWQDWIFAESKLRTAAMYFIFAMCYDVQFGIPCDRPEDYGFGDVDLPAGKGLWEARDEMAWLRGVELAEEGGNKDSNGSGKTEEARLKYGDLVRYNKQLCEIGGKNELEEALARRVEKWQREADEFGILVSLCGTMI